VNHFNSAPFFRILPAFCFGICASFYQWINFQIAYGILSIGISGLLLYFGRKKPEYTHRCYTGISFQFLFFIIGFFFTEIKDERKLPDYFSEIDSVQYCIASLDEAPRGGEGKFRIPVTVNYVFANNNLISACGRCYLYFKNDTNAGHLKTGDRIVFEGTSTEIPPPQNPGQYDFRRRSSIHRIYHRFYLKNDSWERVEPADKFNVRAFSSDLRNRFLNVYKSAGIGGQEYAVLSALVLGYDDEIDAGIMQAFSASGTLHILSVSGMHVGIIFTALSTLLIFMERKKSLHIPRLVILLLALWFYAFLTGLSPSVIRSSMMFSFIIIGQSLNRTSNIYNSLSMSALCIFMLFDPLMLFDVGLQLSFIAVAGIAFLYPKIYKLFYFENKLFDKTWALIAVSIAAQTATFPISIFYFHQFPNYFILANLLIIPLSTIGIFSGIFLLFLQPVPVLFNGLAWFTENVVYVLNRSAILFQEMPGSVWDGISIHLAEMFTIYILLFAIQSFLERKAINYLYFSLSSLIALHFFFIYDNFYRIGNNSLVIFSGTSTLCCQFTKGRNSWLLYHDADSSRAKKYSDDYCLSRGLSTSHRLLISLDDQTNKTVFGNLYINDRYILFNKFLLMDNPEISELSLLSKFIMPDVIYFDIKTGNKKFADLIDTGKIIINDRFGHAGLMEENDKGKKQMVNLRDGAFQMEL